MKLQKIGGYASIVLVCIVFAAVMGALSVYSHYGIAESGDRFNPASVMTIYAGSPICTRLFSLIGILIGVLLLLIALALQERMEAKAPHLMCLTVIAASVSCALYLTITISSTISLASMPGARDISVYRVALVIFAGLRSAASHAWGWALLLSGWAALRTHALPLTLSYMILLCGAMAIIRYILPPFPNPFGLMVAILFAIGMLWLGVVLIRKPEPTVS